MSGCDEKDENEWVWWKWRERLGEKSDKWVDEEKESDESYESEWDLNKIEG